MHHSFAQISHSLQEDLVLSTARAATGSGQPLYTRPASATTLGARWAPIPSILRHSAEVRCVIEHPLPISAKDQAAHHKTI